MSDSMIVQSRDGPYTVHFDVGIPDLSTFLERPSHYLIDSNVARLYPSDLAPLLDHPNALVIDATEDNKSINSLIPVFERLVGNGMRRDHTLVAVGGGIIQDIGCFIASTLLRGVPWRFIPTTLLAQADSCIGSKSSINLRQTKNILGTFKAPMDVFVSSRFLDTLEPREISSGIGEILKVHAIDGADSFDRLASDFDSLRSDRAILEKYIRSALCIKKRYIEEDEFDRGPRNIFNYGHTFGHAIEAATSFAIPHGIAVSMGMDIANHVAVDRSLVSREHYVRMHGTLRRNYSEFAGVPIPMEGMFSALMKDKKNTNSALGLILPVGDDALIKRVMVPPDQVFRSQCANAVAEISE